MVPTRRSRRFAAALIALLAVLSAQTLASHGHAHSGHAVEEITATASEAHEASDCAACVARALRHGPLAPASLELGLSVVRVSTPASEPVVAARTLVGLPPERAPPHSA